MDNIALNLGKLYQTLECLEIELAEEERLLSVMQINPVELQVVTDKKSQLLAAVSYYDEQRHLAEKQASQPAPYRDRRLSERWQHILTLTKKLSDMNIHNGTLMEKQAAFMRKMQSMMQNTRMGQMVYGADGQSRNGVTRRNAGRSV
ncbi:flagella synthesis protein FlgN [Biostraticola tofi]|uniref:Flagella synthesis protein FlgN n=1 Tax=Biostraticola tofi TaxID=466109 RepID=A0A4R3YSY4_9GAMM|nr:flagellar export chaperone FlgN [Biostraticola tofi]TCV95536.1 flagella synthesis protein FlgN [Biostraticola tofi]